MMELWGNFHVSWAPEQARACTARTGAWYAVPLRWQTSCCARASHTMSAPSRAPVWQHDVGACQHRDAAGWDLRAAAQLLVDPFEGRKKAQKPQAGEQKEGSLPDAKMSGWLPCGQTLLTLPLCPRNWPRPRAVAVSHKCRHWSPLAVSMRLSSCASSATSK